MVAMAMTSASETMEMDSKTERVGASLPMPCLPAFPPFLRASPSRPFPAHHLARECKACLLTGTGHITPLTIKGKIVCYV